MTNSKTGWWLHEKTRAIIPNERYQKLSDENKAKYTETGDPKIYQAPYAMENADPVKMLAEGRDELIAELQDSNNYLSSKYYHLQKDFDKSYSVYEVRFIVVVTIAITGLLGCIISILPK